MTRREEDAVETAIRALRHRDRSTAELDARLAKRGIDAEKREQALETLERVGYVDDERFARTRAEQLAARGSGDALIRHDLEQRGVAADVVEAALGSLEPERERAQRLVAQRGATLKTARYLAARGFGEEALEGIVAHDG
jgi:regulatory protein